MSNYASAGRRRYVRSRDRACIGGVCAGLSDYFGFNLKVTRLLAVIAFLCAFPFALLAYLAAVFLFPAEYDPERQPRTERHQERHDEKRPPPSASDLKRRFESMDERLARIERYVTSPRYNLDEEFRKL